MITVNYPHPISAFSIQFYWRATARYGIVRCSKEKEKENEYTIFFARLVGKEIGKDQDC